MAIFKTVYILRLDDIAPNMKWTMMARFEKLFLKYNIKPILGVIPKNEDKELREYPRCDFDFWSQIKKFSNYGWEIAMHGYEHLYGSYCNKIDYLGHGGNTEFAGHSFDVQLKKLSSGLDIFKKQNINVKVFFAPNHTFDSNTVKACKILGFDSIIDGYGLTPYAENGIIFIPQLFYKLFVLPFGLQTIQIHLNYYSEKDYRFLEKFVQKKHEKIISYKEACKHVNNRFVDNVMKFATKKVLQLKRSL